MRATYDIDYRIDDTPDWNEKFISCIRMIGASSTDSVRLTVPSHRLVPVSRILRRTGFWYVFITANSEEIR